MVKTQAYIKTIPFSEFQLWDVKRYNNQSNISFDNVVKLRDILKPYRKAVSKEEMIKNKWQIIAKINFGGQLFLRDFEEINTYKGNLNLVPENAIIYSKINVRHGCIYYNEIGNTPFGVSNEYPTFTFDNTLISGDFLRKVLRSNAFKNLLNSKTSGISKARVKQDEFLDIEIPLPSLIEQSRIVAAYNENVKRAEQQEIQAKLLEEEIEKYLFDELGVVNNISKGVQKGLQTIDYSAIEKWALDDIFKKKTIISNKHKLVNLNSVCSLITDGTHQTPKYFKEGVIFLSARNVTKEVIDWEKIKFVSKEAHLDYTKRVNPEIDDILLAKNGTTGVAAIIDVEKEFSIYVSLALLKPIKEIVFPKFLLHIINSEIARVQFFSRLIGIGVPNLHLGEIKE
ncbi:MAG: restriction endonuclease subunit S, partial [Vicingaceae bacterium]|nr:restriction endonuclease subunit S [Vicingaceae bacterium]